MAVDNERLKQFARTITSDEECLSEVARRISMRFYDEFCAMSHDFQKLEAIAAKQQVLGEVITEFYRIVEDGKDLNSAGA